MVCAEVMGEGCAERIGEVCAERMGEAGSGRAGEGGGGGAGAGGCADGCASLIGEVWEACSRGEMPKMPPHWSLILSRRC